jgi:hypothetical protein
MKKISSGLNLLKKTSTSVLFFILVLIENILAENNQHEITSDLSSGILAGLNSQAFLETPFDGKAKFSTFHGFYSSLFAYQSSLQVYGDPSLESLKVQYTYPKFYNPKVYELLEHVAWQTNATWGFDEKVRQFKFSALNDDILPYVMDLKDDWLTKKRGLYVWHAPKGRTVGMDIYYFGQLSPEKESNAKVFYEDLRKFYSTLLLRISGAPSMPSPETDMENILLWDDVPVLYWNPKSFPGMKEGIIWRQWSFVIDGHAFLIESTMEEQDREKVIVDVDEMLKTLRVNKSFNLHR